MAGHSPWNGPPTAFAYIVPRRGPEVHGKLPVLPLIWLQLKSSLKTKRNGRKVEEAGMISELFLKILESALYFKKPCAILRIVQKRKKALVPVAGEPGQSALSCNTHGSGRYASLCGILHRPLFSLVFICSSCFYLSVFEE